MRLTGRLRATEEVTAYERKGDAGDWRNYFGQILIRTAQPT
jgi:hypothetical protein